MILAAATAHDAVRKARRSDVLDWPEAESQRDKLERLYQLSAGFKDGK